MSRLFSRRPHGLLLVLAASACAHGGRVGAGGGGATSGSGGSGAQGSNTASTGVGSPTSTATGPACSGPGDCASLSDTCNVGTCDPVKGCMKTPTNNGGTCNDGKFCTTGDVCTNGMCAGTPMMCPASMNPCQVGKCDEASMGCVIVPGNDGAACNSGVMCTMNAMCANGMCGAGQPVTACINGDGCCPASCDASNDSDCGNCTTNVALGATATDSGGGTTTHGPQAMNDGVGPTCSAYAWISNGQSPTGAWIELSWPSPTAIGSIYIETDNGLTPMCGVSGRNLASGTVQTWDGAAWVNAGSFAAQHGNIKLNLTAPVKTSKLRVFNVTADPGNGNSIIFEWHVYSGKNCMAPP